jgi:hypothetical protein
MDTMLTALLSWQFLIYCLAIAAIIFVIRKVVEYVLDNPNIPTGKLSKSSRLWRELILPILPVIIGPLSTLLAKKYPYPEGLSTVSGRLAFGLVAGLLSGLVYRLVSAFLVPRFDANQQPETWSPAVEDLASQVRKTINKE